jgi:leader peptidase (prepilin peptidase)/N-methyltransferase
MRSVTKLIRIFRKQRPDNILENSPMLSPLGLSMFADAGFIWFFAPLCLLGGALALIDIRHGIIPDWLNLAIAVLGLSKAIAVGGSQAGLEAAGEAAAIGATFWLLRRLYFALRNIQGLGLGDVKFLAAAGLWIGIGGLPMLLLIATLTALVAAGCMQWTRQNMTRWTSISFGPFLMLGLLITLAVQQLWS